ncbi:MAG: tRNA (adenosine(37)-N6)-threonylcarbamoyltransferase complex ATPase subunit type 1 TsaE [Candidatus Hydrogenedentes bacterium]|nr:tRNA (adenosine(37)-N6)-threonylcarbamoyltransferase complex ATPase subunit type 1 TsaE [Candidatus Hydrogenedentota bacterium]
MDCFKITTHTPEATEALGESLAALLPPGAVLALYGDLATGKTCLTRGMTRHFTGDDTVHSPTFTLVNEYGKDQVLYHIDLYRLGCEEELLTLGYEDFIESNGICVIEWADRAPRFLPAQRIDIHLDHAGGDARTLYIENLGILPIQWQQSLEITATEIEKGNTP